MNVLRRAFAVACLSIPASAWAAVALVVIPPPLFDVEGPSSTQAPFSTDASICNIGSRFQHIYWGDDLATATIGGMAFRQDGAAAAPASFTIPDVIVTLAETNAAAGTVGGTFAENILAGGTVVFSGDMEINSLPVKGGGGPRPFDVVIPFDTGFDFDASKNLVVDIQIPNGSCIDDLVLDATGDPFMAYQLSNDLALRQGTMLAPGFGIVTQFILSTPPPVFNPGGYSGSWWFGPTHDGEGLLIELIEIKGTIYIVVYWFTYDQTGEQMWLVGVAEYAFGPTIIPMERLTGPVFGPGFDPDDVDREAIGTITIEFFGPDIGEMGFALIGGLGAGTYDISRLTSIVGNPPVFGVIKDLATETRGE